MDFNEVGINTRLFVKGLVAKLAIEGIQEVKPHSPSTIESFNRVINYLNEEIKSLKGESSIDEDSYYDLVSLRNELKPSLSGAFDYFEYHLRSLQNSYTSCPNPSYDSIKITVPSEFAGLFYRKRF